MISISAILLSSVESQKVIDDYTGAVNNGQRRVALGVSNSISALVFAVYRHPHQNTGKGLGREGTGRSADATSPSEPDWV
jgi:hypothetical protein